MNVDQLTSGLRKAFIEEGHRIVFWYDAACDFVDELNQLGLDGINIINMANKSALGIKLKLELEDTEGKYLLYFPFVEPELEKDWLLDIKLYSRCFYADRFSIIFSDLGLHQQSVREHLVARDQFLGSKARLVSLKKWVQPDYDDAAVDLAMITTVVKAESCDLPHILFALAEEAAEQDTGLEANPDSLSELEKFGLLPALVSALQKEVGYQATNTELSGETPFKFGTFLLRLLTTGYCESISVVPDWAADLAIPSNNAKATSRALLSRWRDSSRYYKAYDVISKWVASALRIDEKLGGLSLEELAQVATFQDVEQRIIVELAESIPEADSKTLSDYTEIIAGRLDNYWASRHKDDGTRSKFQTIYKSLSAAIRLYSLRLTHSSGFHYSTTSELYKAYEKDLFQIDTAYRHYIEASQRAHVNILKSLDEQVEHCYANWYIDNLAKNWGDLVEVEQRLSDWVFPGINNQQRFYADTVQSVLDAPGVKRTVVIISDAFRYEAAVELCARINEKRSSQATITSQVGVVPSYTTLGMASLLPHNSLSYKEGVGDDVFVDEQSSKGTVARNKILSAHEGLAITADEVKRWSRDEGRAALKDKRLIYVYHNVVDARGDSAATESGTFGAVEEAIEELTELTRKILTQFNTTTVLVTADHGFLFQQSKLKEADKTSLVEKPPNALKSKKRYVIGNNLPATKEAWSGSTKDTAGTSSDTGFLIPKGANRFHFVGGARFVHGGIMPQEIVVPVVTIKQLRGEKAEKRTKRKVGIISVKPSLKMVNNIQKFELMQSEPTSDLLLPVTIVAAIYDADKIVSSEETLSFDSASDSISERVKQITVSLAGTDFDRKKDYYLIIRDKDLNTEIERYRVTIDLAFTDDFF